jgi:hypothetical protein
MIDPMHQQLLGHLLGALDDDEHEGVDARLEHDEEFCRELAVWRQRLAPLEAIRPDFEPPPGLAERTCRYVAARAPHLAAPQRRMTPLPIPPNRVTAGLLDMGVATFVAAVVVGLLFPAINSSRFQTRLATCQNGLGQFGLALGQYGFGQRDPLGQLASNGRLTPAGIFATAQLRDGRLGDGCQKVCPDAWLAAQGVWRASVPVGTPARGLQRPPVEVTWVGPGLTVGPLPDAVQPDGDSCDDWPGTWRDGTMDGWRLPPSPAEMPLLADAPSADLPGQGFWSHGGRGQNVLFEDGHVGFLPSTASRDSADWFLSSRPSAASDVSPPVVLVRGR